MQQCAHPARIGLDVEKRPHVTFAIDVDRVGVLVLALAWIQVTARENGVDVAKAELTIRFGRQPDDIVFGVERVGRWRENLRCFLKERVAVVPRAQVASVDTKALGQMLVQVGFHRLEWLACLGFDLREGFG